MHLSVGMLIPFVILLLANVYFESKGIGLSPSELLTVCCMSMVAAWMQGEGLSGYLLGVITAPHYFASPENRWEELLLQYLPSWAIIPDRELVRGFYEGLPPGQSVPWSAWVTPALWWSLLIVSVLTVNLCVSVLFHKQWMDYEKLAFPIATALLQLTGAAGESGKLSVLLKHRLFRIGFAITFCIFCWNITTWFITGLPLFPILSGRPGKYIYTLSPHFPNVIFAFSLMTFTFGYFTRSEVLFSIWFFHFLAIAQAGLFNRLGYDLGSSDPWCSFHPAVGWQGFGGMIVLVGWGIWTAREHFRDVWRHAVGRTSGGDTEELMVLPNGGPAPLSGTRVRRFVVDMRRDGVGASPCIRIRNGRALYRAIPHYRRKRVGCDAWTAHRPGIRVAHFRHRGSGPVQRRRAIADLRLVLRRKGSRGNNVRPRPALGGGYEQKGPSCAGPVVGRRLRGGRLRRLCLRHL